MSIFESQSIPTVSSDFTMGIKTNRKPKGNDGNDLVFCPECKTVFHCNSVKTYRKSRNKTTYYEHFPSFKLPRVTCNECRLDAKEIVFEMEKKCTRCKKTKPLNEFYQNIGRNSYRAECIQCTRERLGR